MLLLLGAFFAGIITIFAPCVLPLLPVIIGGSLSGDTTNKRRPLVIAASLAVSLIVFTLLLKVSTVFINIPPMAINYLSGGIIIAIGLLTLFPSIYEQILIRTGIQSRSQKLLGQGMTKKGLLGPIIIGAALGPVFSSCSPVYAYILATILPTSFTQAFVYIIAYVLGLSIMLLLVGYYGQKFIAKVTWAADPKGWFQRSVAVLFILVGLLVFTGSAIKVQTYISQNTPFNFDGLSAKLIPGFGDNQEDQEGVLNVKPYTAPEFAGLEHWINSEPLTKQDLKGKVVLVDFWTYSCINCIRTQPYLKGWYETYKNNDFVVIGVHAPEFSFEKVPANVEKAVKDAGITYPVALDNQFQTWTAFKNQFWPSSYLIDAEGNVRRAHYGEGEYKETEQAIRTLIRENTGQLPTDKYIKANADVPVSKRDTPETYLGAQRASNYVGQTRLISGRTQTFETAELKEVDDWTLGGVWEVGPQTITARGESTLTFRMSAKEVYLVAGADTPQPIKVTLNGRPISNTSSSGSDVKDNVVEVSEQKLYRLVRHTTYNKDFMIQLSVPDGTVLNVFTFGS